jgi:hypothetical protein
MGADFIVAYARQSDKPDALKTMVQYAPPELIMWIEEDAGDEWLYEDIAEEGDDPYKQYRELLVEAIDYIHNEQPRDITWIHDPDLGDRPIILTGGMSWGDDPTESYQQVMRYGSIVRVADREAAMTAEEAVKSLDIGG